jgi:hypothetical protein
MNEELRQLRIENKLLREEKKQALQDSEQYRLQMAGISTAAIGYWKEGDSIHPDYDTPALRDVAKLYAELFDMQDVSHSVIAGALFDFMGWLTSRPKRIMLSSADEASPAVDAIKEFAKMRGLSLDDAQVQDWQDYTTPPTQPATVQEPVWIQPDHLQKAQKAPFLCRVEPHKRDDFVALYTTPPVAPVQERNFCERCGKRIGDSIHTCTPPLKEST